MNGDRGPVLLALARGAIGAQLGEAAPDLAVEPWLQEPGAAFVSIHLQEELRGCVGSLAARRPLGEDVAFNALAAAFQDSRFPPLTRSEFLQSTLEVSLLSPLEPIEFQDQAHLLSQLRPGVDGVVLEFQWWRGTFLPQVWEQLPEPQAFLTQLKQKAGLPRDFWSEDIRFSRYTVHRWREQEIQESRR